MDSFKGSLSKGLTMINVKTSNFMEESKAKTYISTLEKDIATNKMNLGEMIYQRWMEGEAVDEALLPYLQEIKEKYDQIEAQKQSMEQLRIQEQQILGTTQDTNTGKVIYCSKCGSTNAANYKFCVKCGNPLA